MNETLKKRGISKPLGIGLFTTVMLVMAAIILFYQNPLADRGQELMKKNYSLCCDCRCDCSIYLFL